MITETLIAESMQRVKTSLIESQRSKGLRASGRSAESLDVKTTREGGTLVSQLYGATYWLAQQSGRKPGRYPKPSRAFVESIREWLSIRGLDYSPYAVAFKINRDGIRVPNRFNPGGVLNPLLPGNAMKLLAPTLLPTMQRLAVKTLFNRDN